MSYYEPTLRPGHFGPGRKTEALWAQFLIHKLLGVDTSKRNNGKVTHLVYITMQKSWKLNDVAQINQDNPTT